MSRYFIILSMVLILVSWHCALSEEEDDDIKGPLIPPKEGGGLYTTLEIIKLHNYKGESHEIQTESGYKLSCFRILTDKQPAIPVLLQHGYLVSSDGWVTDNKSLAFKLSDAGYDVWINNARGNAYSRSHIKLSPDEKEFWDFSWHDMGTEDIPAVTDHIIKVTGKNKLHYIGHSMGTTISFVTFSQKPEYNEKYFSNICFAPVAYLSKLADMMGPEGMIADIGAKYMEQFKESGKLEIFPRKDMATNKKTQITCDDVEDNFRDMCIDKVEGAQVVLGAEYLPAGQSTKTMRHFYQFACDGIMKRYKYDTPEENKKVYGQEDPPKYEDDFNKITIPVYLGSCEMDQITVDKDVTSLKEKLPNVKKEMRIEDDCFDHVTFLFPSKKSCLPVREKFYNDVIEFMKSVEK